MTTELTNDETLFINDIEQHFNQEDNEIIIENLAVVVPKTKTALMQEIKKRFCNQINDDFFPIVMLPDCLCIHICAKTVHDGDFMVFAWQ